MQYFKLYNSYRYTILQSYVFDVLATDECWPNPCQYGGTCADKLMDFACKCKDPMSGKICNEGKDTVKNTKAS